MTTSSLQKQFPQSTASVRQMLPNNKSSYHNLKSKLTPYHVDSISSSEITIKWTYKERNSYNSSRMMNSPSQFHCRQFFVVHHATIKINSTRNSLKCWIVLPFILVLFFYVCGSTICTLQFQSTLYTETNFCVTLRLESEQGLSGVVFSKLAKLYEPTDFLFLSPLLFCNRPETKVSCRRTEAG